MAPRGSLGLLHSGSPVEVAVRDHCLGVAPGHEDSRGDDLRGVGGADARERYQNRDAYDEQKQLGKTGAE